MRDSRPPRQQPPDRGVPLRLRNRYDPTMKNSVAVVAVLALAAIALTGCAASPNATACKLYENGYNQLMDAVRNKEPAATVRAENAALPSRVSDAFDKATGDVAVAIGDSKALASQMVANPGNSDTGTAFFMQAKAVVKACSAAGAGITLHSTE